MNDPANYTPHHGSSSMSGMGTIKMEVFGGISLDMVQRSDFTSSFSASSIKRETNSVALKKNLRSGKGRNESSYNRNQYEKFQKGAHLFTTTLYYCAAPGLIAVGIYISQPPLWDYHRMLKPAVRRSKRNKDAEDMKSSIVSVTKNRRGNEIIELADKGYSRLVYFSR